jgi:NAD(P)-dependent dehydrogenase (short-subunit alcohol dehydrogenase family)
MRLKNKVAIVTGGARAMREAETRLFATESTKVIVADVLAAMRKGPPQIHGPAAGRPTAAKIDVTSEAGRIGLIPGR